MRKCSQCHELYAGRGKLFCSRDCRGLAMRKRVTIVCELCQTSREVWLSTRLKGAKYCSNKCQGIGSGRTRTVPRPYVNCLYCKKDFQLKKPSQPNKYCSDYCRQRDHSRIGNFLRGPDHPLWEGKTSKLRQIRKSYRMILWRKAVFERDNYTCQMCNKRGGILNADHIKPFAYCPELRFDISNGRTLCKSCHLTTDTYGGRAQKRRLVWL